MKAGHWVIANKEWLFSGVGVAVAGWLLARLRRKPEPTEPVQESGSGMRNTFHCNGGEQNIAQGKDAVAKQVNMQGAQVGVVRDNAKVEGGIYFGKK